MKRLLILGLSLISLAGMAQSNVDAGEQINRGFQKLGSGYRLMTKSDSAWLNMVKTGLLPLPQLDAKLNKADTNVFARKNVLSNYVALLMADKLNKVDTNVFVRKNVFTAFQSLVTLNKLNVSDTSALARKTALAALQTTFTTGLGTKEPVLGNPTANGYALVSTSTGVRSWTPLPLSTRGTNNLFLGTGAGNATLTGSGNTALGQGAGSGITSGADNVYIGRGAMAYSNTGSNNVAIGADAYVPNSASNNVLVGWGVGSTVTNNVVYVGYLAGSSAFGTQSNGVALGADVLNGAGSLSNFFTAHKDYNWLVGTYTNNNRDKMQVNGSMTYKFYSAASPPTTSDLKTGECLLWKVTGENSIKFYCNDSGLIRPVPTVD